jgi:hypothetical protein
MKMLKWAVIATVLSTAPAQAAPVNLVNAGFEDGLNGWTTVGISAVATPSTTITTYDGTEWDIFAAGTSMAQLNPNGTSVAVVEAALGVAVGTLTDPTGPITDAVAIYQAFAGNAGDTVTMFWDYVATDYIPFSDPAFALVIGPSGTVQTLASIYGNGQTVGTSGHSGWQKFSYTLGAAGDYKLAFVTTNTRDTVLDSFLFLDNQPGSCDPQCPPPVVPEPASAALLALGGVFAIARRLRR